MKKIFNTIVLRNPFVEDMKKFREFANRSADAGVTHLTFTEIERSYWEIDDPADPYLNWSIVHTSMLKIFPPEILKDWVPTEYAKRAREMISERASILKEAGLKGASFLYDPMYWPEEVFQRRPDLRGPRTDMPERCIHPRYSPCIDHPEVLSFYRDSFRSLYDLSGKILDLIIIRSGDSGAGVCWSDLYNGANGPEKCRNIRMQDRIGRFMRESLSDIQKVGGETRIFIGGGKFLDSVAELISGMPEAGGFYSHARTGKGGERILSGFHSNFSLYPVKGIPNPLETLDRLSSCHELGWKDIVFFTCPALYGNDWDGDLPVINTISSFLRRPVTSRSEKIALLRKVAGDIHGSENADDVLDAWLNISEGADFMKAADIGTGGFFIFLTSLAQRWLTRPLVAFPENLSEDERSYYKPYLFQANPAHESPDLLDLEPARIIEGAGGLQLFNQVFDAGFSKYNSALAKLRRASVRSGADSELAKQVHAIQILICILRNIKNCVNFQIKIERLKNIASMEKEYCSKFIQHKAMRRAMIESRWERVEINRLLRAEIDNSLELAGLLEGRGIELIETASLSNQQTAFLLGVNLAEDLHKKTKIMMNHIAEIDQLIGFMESR
ncbi:MAG TPA: hypothetical protein PK821_05755 [Victivallales bacterium]|nr:hypothetical protein [Victivallales bacterium]